MKGESTSLPPVSVSAAEARSLAGLQQVNALGRWGGEEVERREEGREGERTERRMEGRERGRKEGKMKKYF